MKKQAYALLALFCAALWLWAGACRADINVNRTLEAGEGEPKFARVIDDLPLMPGLALEEDRDVLFVAGPGRIAQTTAVGKMDVDTVYYFYQRSLPQLGWAAVDARTYERGNERLRIDVSGVNPKAMTIVRFSVQPVDEGK